jgi:heme-degrading monooxygenase HmoA
MATLITTNVKNQTAEGYDEVLIHLEELIKKTPGFVLHSLYASNGEWFVLEVWNSKAEADHFFSTYVAPNIPKGIIPKRSYQELHSLVV